MDFSTIDSILENFEADLTISDIHLASNSFVTYRKLGDITFMTDLPKITHEQMDRLLQQLLSHHPEGYERFLQHRELDFNFYSKGGTPYRINAYFKLENIGVAMRKISYKPLPLEDLMYDDVAQAIKDTVLNQKTGLFLVTWPTWSWKTTTLIAMLEYLNLNRKEHIITIEDPIEYIFEPKNCLISQRELGSDTLSFPNAMKSAMREDPNIILVWEIRDPATAEAAINLAETGHLVFSTLHTRSASNTVARLISFFPPDIQESIKDRLSSSLIGVQSQFLLQTQDNTRRIGLFEFMINNAAIRNNIRKDDGKQIDSIIETSRQRGMISHMEYAKRLIADKIITKKQVEWLFE